MTTELPLNSTEETIEYEDFDDLQEERSLLEPPPVMTMMKYFTGLISLLALMYKSNTETIQEPKDSLQRIYSDSSERGAHESRGREKRFKEAEDRYDFPIKQFKKNKVNGNNQQFESLENYPPYNPLTANAAETYGNVDQKTSYDAYEGQKTLEDYKDSQTQTQDPHSYGIPYETAKPVKSSSYGSNNDDGTSWNAQNVHPVYQPWMSKPATSDLYSTLDSYQSQDSFKTSNVDAGQSWNGKFPISYPMYHDDFHSAEDHHTDEHFDHAVDEDRVNKKPYSYYFLGRKLWYVPLLFSVYFIIYIGALILKSFARHKIHFPEKIWDLHEDVYGHAKNGEQRKIDEITENYENAVEKAKNKFM